MCCLYLTKNSLLIVGKKNSTWDDTKLTGL